MVKDTELYDRLNIDSGCSEGELKKAYRKMAMKYHPDKNKEEGAEAKFKEVTEAYEILSDSDKRSQYDRYGMDVLKEGGGGGFHNAHDVFENLFGMFGGGGGRRGPQKGEDIVHPLDVPLEDLYKGKTKKLSVSRHVLCTKCTGTGAKAGGKVNTCGSCKGHGSVRVVRQVGPGMITQMQTACPDCRGKGEVIKDTDKCGKCKGQKVMKEKKILEVNIDKGMSNGQKIVFAGESDQSPGLEAGDIIFVIREQPHNVYKRDQMDLHMEKNIPLLNALTGFSMELTHLDGRKLVFRTGPGDIIKPNETRSIVGEGMPKYRSPFQLGNLVVTFNIVFPVSGSISEQAAADLAKVLPAGAPKIPESDDLEEHEFSATTESYHNHHARDAYDEDEDGGHGGQGVSCAQQ